MLFINIAISTCNMVGIVTAPVVPQRVVISILVSKRFASVISASAVAYIPFVAAM